MRGLEFLHVMQPQPQLNIGFSGVSSVERTELSQWVENVTKQLLEDLPENENENENESNGKFQAEPPRTAVHDSGGILAVLLSEFRPRKVSRRSSDQSPGLISMHHQQEWSNDQTTFGIEGPEKASSSASDEQGLNLLARLLECAVAISVDNLGDSQKMLLELTQTASPYSDSCAERVVAYFAKAMSSRVINSWLGVSSPLIDYKTTHAAFQVYNNVSPFVKFAHFTSNQAILEAFHRQDRVHIIDFDIMQGLQWPALFHILATRAEGPPQVRMSGLGSSIDLLTETGKQLSNFARRLGLHFEFYPIHKKCGELVDLSSLQIRSGDALAVHWLQHSLYDATGHDRHTLRVLQGLAPRVITLVEQELAHGGSFLDRFVSSLHYYSTVFDSLGVFMPPDDPSRHRVEHGLLHREINNVLAIGGPARSGEEKFRHWRGQLSRNGFVQIPMSKNSMAQAQLILNMYPNSVNGYRLVQGDGTLRLGWKETSLYTASAWTYVHP